MENQEIKKKKLPVRLIVILLLAIVGGYFAFKKLSFAYTHESTDNAQIETQITPVLPRVSGYVKHIAVNDYDTVKTGALVAELDDAELQSQLLEMDADLQQANADLINAKASLNNAVVSLRINKGNVDLNKMKVAKATDDLNRDNNLFSDQAITRKQLDDTKYNLETANQQFQNSQSDMQTAESRIAILQASIQKALAAIDVKKAKIEQQKLKISYTKIYAPQAGKIGRKNVSEGQYVQAGTPLFSIVNDTTYWIVANFKETQIKKFHSGSEVDIELDAYPDIKLKGEIESVSEATGARFSLLPADNASGNFVKVTQRIPVKINIKNLNQHKDILRAGLSVYVSVPIK